MDDFLLKTHTSACTLHQHTCLHGEPPLGALDPLFSLISLSEFPLHATIVLFSPEDRRMRELHTPSEGELAE